MNKFALVFYFYNEAHWLNLHLPYLAPHFDLIIGIDDNSHDGSRYIVERCGGIVYDRVFDHNHSHQINFAIEMAQKHGATHLLRLDPDETIFAGNIAKVRQMLSQHDALYLPRMTFEKDRNHVWADVYPDWQLRAFKADVRWSGQVHESPLPDIRNRGYSIGYAVDTPIFHYEGLHSAQYKALKHTNCNRLVAGEPPLARFDSPAEHRRRVSYAGHHPIEAQSERAPLPSFDIQPYRRDGTRVWVRNDTDRAVLDQVQTEYNWNQMPTLNRVIDIGGHAGYFSVEAKRRYPKAKISVVEVERQNFELLQFHLGHWTDIDLHLARCGYEDGDFELAFNHMSSSSHRVVRRGSFTHDHFRSQTLDVPMISLEALTPDNEAIDLLKLDCEGSEIDILLNVSDEWLSRVSMIVGERHMTMTEFAAVHDRLSKYFDVTHIAHDQLVYAGWFTATRK